MRFQKELIAMLKKLVIATLIMVVAMSTAVFADAASRKTIETNLSKKVTTFKVKGPRGVLPGEFFNLMDKYRVNTNSYTYDTKTQTMTFKVTYNTGNLNTAVPDVIVKSDEELRKFLYDYTKGKLQHTIYLTTKNTLDKTTNDMFVIKLDYPVSSWTEAAKIVNYVDLTMEADYRRVMSKVVDYNHQVQPVSINSGWTKDEKAYWDKWLGNDLEIIAKNSKDQWEIIYNWYKYVHNTYMYDGERLGAIRGLSNTYKPELDKPFVEDKTGICQDYARVSKYALSELGIPNMIVTGRDHAWNESVIYNQIYYTDAGAGRFYRLDKYAENVIGPSFNYNEITFEEFMNKCVLEQAGN
jgi:hypothetical protein